jgi:hypothetical protein
MRRSPIRTQAVALGILIVASVIGNVSVSAARIRPDASIAPLATTARDEVSVASSAAAPAPFGEMPSVTPSTGAAGQIVPAIYSWDPDVTFVFYRHVTKWM